MKLIWLTDIHLNFLENEERKKFYDLIISENGDAILLSGDIAEAPSIVEFLTEMVGHIKRPIYFVLGNHDYYGGQVDIVRKNIMTLTNAEPLLYWLPACEPKLLANRMVLIGQDGWADGRYGDFNNSRVGINDSLLIADLFQQKIMSKEALLKKMQQLADADAKQLNESIERAIVLYHPQKIIVLTHVPPFKEAYLYQGKIGSDEWLPYFSSKIMGEVLLSAAQKNSAIDFLVLCGHTHSEACYSPLVNLTVKVGKSEYSQPSVQETIIL